ncbi:hypothetical protein QQG55_51915 [Brugia pahangi]
MVSAVCILFTSTNNADNIDDVDDDDGDGDDDDVTDDDNDNDDNEGCIGDRCCIAATNAVFDHFIIYIPLNDIHTPLPYPG